jgi:PAS domain S-box-containing protein
MNNRPFSSLSSPLRWGAFKIAGLYLLIGSLWILFSDRLAERIALNKEMLASLSLYKGWAYVIVTAFLLYWLIQRDTGRLHASEKQLQVVINALPVLISYVDKNRHYQFTNEAYEEWFGEKAQGKRIEELIGEATYQKISKYVDKALNGETVFYETEIPYQDGGERFVSATYIPDIQTDGQVRGFFALVQDISEQKESKEKLRQWADAFEGCAHGIAISDPDTNRVVVCNPAFANMLKCRVEDIVGSSILSLYAPSDHEHVRGNIERADQIGRVRYEAQMTRRDRSLFPVQMDVVSVLGEDGELLYRVATAQDISQRKQAEEGLHRFELLSEHSRDIILFMRRNNGRILEANAAAIQAYGYSRQELLALTIGDLRARDTHSLTAGQMAQADAGGILFETIHLRKDGTTFPVEVSSQGANIGGERILISVVRDITERKGTEEELRRNEERYRYLFENNPYPMWIYDRKTLVFLDVNEAAITKYGYSRQEFLNMTIVNIRPPEDVERLISNLAQPRQPLEQSDGWRHRLKDGTTIYVEITSHTLELDRHESVFVIAQDITERIQAQNTIRLKDELLRLTSEMAKVGGWEFDTQTLKGTWTDEVAKIHDLEPSQESNVELGLSFYVGESLKKIEQAIKDAVEHARPYDLELKMVSAKGNHKWVRTSALPILDEGKVVKVQGIFQDITERKQIEEALQKAHAELEAKVQERTAALSQANALLQALMDTMPDQIYFKDLQCRFIRNSRSQASLLGLSDPIQVVGKTDFDFFPHASKAYAEEQEVMRSGKPLIDFEEWVVWPDGRESWVSTTKVPLRNSDGETIGIFGISRDITERKRTEQAIRELNTDLENQAAKLQIANKELEAFSYSVSHDLRAPLRAIDGYTRILVEDYEAILDAEGKRVCGIISAEARRMGQLIDDLLAFSRLGRKEMYSSNIDMKALVVSVLNELIKEGDRERIDFKIARLPSARADSSLMRQVWVNLLSNALKFTSKKERAVIEVGSKSGTEEVTYYVHDSGAGFDMEYANKLFGVFQRLHSESEFEGTGVGLAIVQRIIRRHDGRVWAEGEIDKGATFYFALPRKEHHHE